MPTSSRLILIFKTIRQLGWQRASLYARYQLGLRTGHYRRLTDPKRLFASSSGQLSLNSHLLTMPNKDELISVTGFSLDDLIAEADEIIEGEAHLFGGPPTEIDLTSKNTQKHWTDYETGKVVPSKTDVKLLWEPARFGFVFTLGRAFITSREEKYPEAFWRFFDQFASTNPPYNGPQWMSAQEAAFRIIAFAFASAVFASSTTFSRERQIQLAYAIAAHAERIPPTLVYARAQNNNHLLLEAAGLYTAGKTIPNHPCSARWCQTGWMWFNKALEEQISSDGTYVQHSVNYHRLMLQVGLWMHSLSGTLPQVSCQLLGSATSWLLALVDPISGHCPNLGPNDGALLFPLTGCDFADYRPVCQAASQVFLNRHDFQPGPWNELALWVGRETPPDPANNSVKHGSHIAARSTSDSQPTSPHLILSSTEHNKWAYLRSVEFSSRPGHADQLHLDLWWQGMNIARDAGTFSYNQLQPWNNSLAKTKAHNTITVDNADQMTSAGKFLWLDWAQARLVSQETNSSGQLVKVTAEHDGYRKLGITHQRTINLQNNGWEIIDSLLPDGKYQHKIYSSANQATSNIFTLYWHLPDFAWEFTSSAETGEASMRLKAPNGSTIQLHIQPDDIRNKDHRTNVQIIRAGVLEAGIGNTDPTLGWYSPTYNVKEPSLTLVYQIIAPPPVTLVSIWDLA